MDAVLILQGFLDEIGAAVMTEDWETYRSGICLPCHIISQDESKVVSTEADLKAGFDQFCDTLRAQRVTDYIRVVQTAGRLDETLISGKYVTHLVSGSQRVLPPFQSQMTLRLVGNRWRAASVTNALANSRWPLVRLAVHPDEDPKGPET